MRPDIRLIDLEMMTFDWCVLPLGGRVEALTFSSLPGLSVVVRYLPMLEKTFPGVVFPAEVKTYRFGAEYFDMKKFFDHNIDKFDIFVFEKLNPEDHTWEAK